MQYSSNIYDSSRLQCQLSGISDGQRKCCTPSIVGTNTSFSTFINFGLILHGGDSIILRNIELEVTNDDNSITNNVLTKFYPFTTAYNSMTDIGTVVTHVTKLNIDTDTSAKCARLKIFSNSWNDLATFICYDTLW